MWDSEMLALQNQFLTLLIQACESKHDVVFFDYPILRHAEKHRNATETCRCQIRSCVFAHVRILLDRSDSLRQNT